LWKGALAGAVAGLAASYLMAQFQTGWSKIKQKGQQRDEEPQHDQAQSEDATMKAAGAIARTVFRKELTPEQKTSLGPVVHYGFGTLVGAVYGGLREDFDVTSLGWGTAFSSGVFIAADEIAVPLFGLSASPTKSPLSTHLYAWASHLVYGVGLESVRRPLRSAMGYDDWGSKVRRAQDTGEDTWEKAGKITDATNKRARTGWKTSMKNVEKAARRMRKTA
jgi:putative membrane protein